MNEADSQNAKHERPSSASGDKFGSMAEGGKRKRNRMNDWGEIRGFITLVLVSFLPFRLWHLSSAMEPIRNPPAIQTEM